MIILSTLLSALLLMGQAHISEDAPVAPQIELVPNQKVLTDVLSVPSAKPRQANETDDMSPLAKPGGNVNPPYPTNVVWPDNMPHNARPTHIVLISLVVGVDGKVHDARVVQSRGKDSDEKALEAVRKWVFRPATKDGHKVAVTVQVEVPSR